MTKDNTTLQGTGVDDVKAEVFASDHIGDVHHQRVKISVGPDGKATDSSLLNSLPVADYTTRDFLNEIMNQMILMNMHLKVITDCDFNTGDIER